MARKSVPQVVDAQLVKASLLANLDPDVRDFLQTLPRSLVPEQPRIVWAAGKVVDDCARWFTQPDRARSGLTIAKFEAAAFNVGPLKVHDFAVAAAGKQQQSQ